MNPVDYLRKNGLKHTLWVIYAYKLDIVIQLLLGIIFKNWPLQNIIVIESHDDFDSNGGALYNYLIKNEYNKKIKIVWAVKHPELVIEELPKNVDWYAEYKPGIKKNYYKWVAKWFSYDQDCSSKLRNEQISIFMTHGAVGLKDCTGLVKLPKDLNYCLTASEWWKIYDAKQFLMRSNDERLKICGYPAHDFFYNTSRGDLVKITHNIKYKKVVMWMPTFRKNASRNDCIGNSALGVPLLKSKTEFLELTRFLQERNIFMIIKIHPKQDLEDLRIHDSSNIKVLTGLDMKMNKIDNYRLMKDVDALISDYSTVAYDFLHVNKPIAYDLSDLKEYVRGIVVDDPHKMMAGHEIREFQDMLIFLDDISNNKDPYMKERKILFDRLFKYHDGNSAKRVVELLGIKKS